MNIRALQADLIAYVLMAAIEELIGRVPTDAEIRRRSFIVQFPDTALSRVTIDGKHVSRFWVWEHRHVYITRIPDKRKPLNIKVTRLESELWPAALCAYITRHQRAHTSAHA